MLRRWRCAGRVRTHSYPAPQTPFKRLSS